jgi:hypothetical protein
MPPAPDPAPPVKPVPRQSALLRLAPWADLLAKLLAVLAAALALWRGTAP